MQQIVIANRRVRRMNAQAKNLQHLWNLVKFSFVALLLGSVVLALSGCQSNPPVPQVSVFRPSPATMETGELQFLLPEALQRKAPVKN